MAPRPRCRPGARRAGPRPRQQDLRDGDLRTGDEAPLGHRARGPAVLRLETLEQHRSGIEGAHRLVVLQALLQVAPQRLGADLGAFGDALERAPHPTERQQGGEAEGDQQQRGPRSCGQVGQDGQDRPGLGDQRADAEVEVGLDLGRSVRILLARPPLVPGRAPGGRPSRRR